MILNLHVRNLALISEVDVDFRPGLNILTGETGAGKSIIIGSINLALGAKADKELIRTGAEYALIELTFMTETEEQKQMFREMLLPIEEDGSIVLQRKILANRSICKICGETVTGAQLKELAPCFLDMYGQHDHHTLLQTKKHLEILDSFGDSKLADIKRSLKNAYEDYRAAKVEAEELDMNQDGRERELSLAEYELNEINSANIRIGEDEELESKYYKLQNAFKIEENLRNVLLVLHEGEENASQQIDRALRELNGITNYDDKLRQYSDNLNEVEDLLHCFIRDTKSYLSELNFSAEDFDNMGERLDVLNHLKSKYGSSLEKVLEYRDTINKKIDRIVNFEENRRCVLAKLEEEAKRMNLICENLSSLRKKEAKKLEKEIQNALCDLNFLSANFEIAFERDDTFHTNGFDKVEFLISTNPGEPVKPLTHVSSGGELSRIMLAIKTISAKRDAVNTLIFDEIDTGISGKTAWKVAEKLGALAKDHQIICITHLPQIAAMADAHFAIEKAVKGQETQTALRELNEDEILSELARMIGGEDITESATKHAGELKGLALTSKQMR